MASLEERAQEWGSKQDSQERENRLMALRASAPAEGGWYSQFDPQPIELIEKWGLDHHRATILQYLVRSDLKNGIEDLKKARWYLDRLIFLKESK